MEEQFDKIAINGEIIYNLTYTDDSSIGLPFIDRLIASHKKNQMKINNNNQDHNTISS